MKNCLGVEAVLPYYIWANDDCDAKSEGRVEAKAICLALIAAGGKSAHIVDAEGVEVPDDEIDAAQHPPEVTTWWLLHHDGLRNERRPSEHTD